MAWNEPGKSPGKRNPWEQRPGRSSSNGKTGLDEFLRQLRKKFSTLNGSAGAPGAAIGGIVILVVLLLLWASTGLLEIHSSEVAVITRFGKFVRIEQPGRVIHLPWPIEDAQIVNVGDDQHSQQLRILTRDEALVDVVYAIRFRRADVLAYAFNVRDPDATLDEVAQSAVREVFASETLNTVMGASRQTLAKRTRDLIQNALDSYKAGIELSGVDIADVRVPAEVKAAQDEVNKAQTESSAATAHAHEYANDVIPKAMGTAAAIRQEAEGYKSQRIALATGETERFLKLLPEYQRAPAVTRERLYLETMESIYANTHKVLVDAKGNGINVYVDKSSGTDDHTAASASVPGNADDAVITVKGAH